MNGVELALNSPAKLPAQKIIVIIVTRASVVFVTNAVIKENGMVREASLAFSAGVLVSDVSLYSAWNAGRGSLMCTELS